MARLKFEISQEKLAKEIEGALTEGIDRIINQASETGEIIVCLTPEAKEMVNKRIAERFSRTGDLHKPTVMMQDQFVKKYKKKFEATNLLTHTRH